METKKRVIDIRGMQNAEREISEIIKEEYYSKIVGASLDGTKLTILFETEMRGKKVQGYVTQVSKKKYNGLDEFFPKYVHGGPLVAIVETSKYWLLFSNKKVK